MKKLIGKKVGYTILALFGVFFLTIGSLYYVNVYGEDTRQTESQRMIKLNEREQEIQRELQRIKNLSLSPTVQLMKKIMTRQDSVFHQLKADPSIDQKHLKEVISGINASMAWDFRIFNFSSYDDLDFFVYCFPTPEKVLDKLKTFEVEVRKDIRLVHDIRSHRHNNLLSDETKKRFGEAISYKFKVLNQIDSLCWRPFYECKGI